MKPLGKGAEAVAIETPDTCGHDGQSRHEKRRPEILPALAIKILRSAESDQMFLETAIYLDREVTVRGRAGRVGVENADTSANDLGERLKGREVAARALAKPGQGFLANGGAGRPFRVRETQRSRLLSQGKQGRLKAVS